MDAISSGDESDAEPMSMEMLEDICDGIQSHIIINRREACYKICDRIKRWQAECNGALLSTWNMGKGLHKLLKAVVDDICTVYQFLVNTAQKFLTSF